jgi:D-arabinose 1-dehydrogenase-like Zn-dependent alcohol dehydrogenase
VRAVLFERFGELPDVVTVSDPAPTPTGAVLAVEATGLCRSDWHGWLGHDPDVRLPHVPGHEMAGVVQEVGADVLRWRPGQRVTVPFVCACGSCGPCLAGDQQVCEHQFQPGFTHWGSFAEYVAVEHADVNLVALPDTLDSVTAASLGCRFATAYRAVLAQGRTRAGEWVAVHGCGGVGLSAVMIAVAEGARVVAVDVAPAALAMAASLGAEVTIDAGGVPDVAAAVRDATGGGAHVSLDALGSLATCVDSVNSLRSRGRHVQVGLLPPALGVPQLPMHRVIGQELQILGSHGMAAHAYPQMLAAVTAGLLRPQALVTRRITLAEAPAALAAMSTPGASGVGAPKVGVAGVTVPGVTVVEPQMTGETG